MTRITCPLAKATVLRKYRTYCLMVEHIDSLWSTRGPVADRSTALHGNGSPRLRARLEGRLALCSMPWRYGASRRGSHAEPGVIGIGTKPEARISVPWDVAGYRVAIVAGYPLTPIQS